MNLETSMITFDSACEMHITAAEFWIIIAGKANVMIGGESSVWKAQELVRVPAGTCLRIEPSDPLTAGVIRVEDFVHTRNQFLHIQGENVLPLITTFFYVIQMKGLPIRRRELIMAELAQLLWDVVMSVSLVPGQFSPAVESVLKDIEEHVTDPEYVVYDAIRATGYSDSYFRKLFRKENGVSPLEYLGLKRLEHAKKLMRQHMDSMSLTEYAIQSVFSDPGNFARFFKKVTGESPRNYLDRIIKEAKEKNDKGRIDRL